MTSPHADGPVVVGVDGSVPAQRALRWAVDHARARRLPLVAVHASPLLYTGVGYEVCLPDPAVLAAEADRFLHHQVDQVDASGLVVPDRAPRRRRPSQRSPRRRQPHGLAGRRRLSRPRTLSSVLLGSVSDQVAHHAASPVVVVP